MRVEQILKTKGSSVVTVDAKAPLVDAARLMARHKVGALVVLVHGGHLHGVLSEREIVAAMALRPNAHELLVEQVMLVRPPTVTPTDTVVDAMHLITAMRVRHLPVINKGMVVGLISIGDVVKARLSEKITENLVLQDITRWTAASLP
jgi:CBS domain-containing protein